MKSNRFVTTGALVCLSLTPFLSPAASLTDEMKRVVILDNGRLKPLDTFARRLLHQISGRYTFAGHPAIDWLTRLLFTPEAVSGDAVFLIENRDVRITLGLPDPERARYSFAEMENYLDGIQKLVQSGSAQDERSRSPLENDMLQLYHNLTVYFQLGVSLAALTPRTQSEESHPPDRSQGQPVELIKSPLLAVIPPDSGQEAWKSPWEIAKASPADPRIQYLLAALSRAVTAAGQDNFAAAAGEIRWFNDEVRRRTAGALRGNKIGWELLYNRIDAFFIAMILYAAAFLLLLIFLLSRRRWLYRLSLTLAFLGLLPHSAGFVLRLLITGRPPVTNLFETFIFVAWAAAVIGVFIECLQKKNLGLFAGSFTAFIFLLISGHYAQAGDTMGILVAVLNTNLWLTVHVTTVTLGYAGCVVAGIIGHIYIIQSLSPHPDETSLSHTYRSLYATLAFGLVFTFLGTIMGGIWADQSWGRFWGWDPKENGALLIILWLAILFHARRAGLIGRLGFAAGSVVLIITVILAWFGVNLLGVGMHAYGFISGVNRVLIAFLALEIFFLMGAAFRRRRRTRLPKETTV